MEIPFVNRELSWLDFNRRVLQEAQDANVPLIERIRFIGIFSNNLDEFYKVRYATVKRIAQMEAELPPVEIQKAEQLLQQITQKTRALQDESFTTIKQLTEELKGEQIYVLDEHMLDAEHASFVHNYFDEKVSPSLITVIISEETRIPNTKGSDVFLGVKMTQANTEKPLYALIQIPTHLDRIVVLPARGDKKYIMLLDDLIRHQMQYIFSIFSPTSFSAHMVKFTRDAELDFDDDINKSYVDKIASSVRERVDGDPVRFVYDKNIAPDTLELLLEKFQIGSRDSIIPSGRYHNRRDYIKFPSLGRTDLIYDKKPPLPIKDFSLDHSILTQIAQRDYLQYTPYHSFAYVIKFLREAALDPKVKSVFITIYRLSNDSQVANALIQAARNGKRVTVQIELQARFDEESNIRYAEMLKNEGVRLVFGIPSLKVHSKICLIQRQEDDKLMRYGFISTGNFNESTARIYTDYTLFTADQSILKEVNRVFTFLEKSYKVPGHKQLLISPFTTSSGLKERIEREIAFAKDGKNALIRIKINNLTNYEMVEALYKASQAGVQIRMIVRGICCLVPGIKGFSENIEVVSVVDRFLEHPRMVIFENGGNRDIFISSSDWMTRNLDNRVEVSCPIYDKDIQQEMIDTFELSWNDNVKSRWVNSSETITYRTNGATPLRSQEATYAYYHNKIEAP
ncbi:MAG: polyphosphate kinase 1 [Flavobacteriaceae bacterium]